MNQPAKREDLRIAMPNTARWVEERRKEFGAKYVNGCMRRAMAGERNQFFAVEAGHFLGSPFDWETKGAYVVSMSILCGAAFVAAFRDPKDTVQMVVQPPGEGAA